MEADVTSPLEYNLERFAFWQPHISIQLGHLSPKRGPPLSSTAEAILWFKELDLSDTELLYVFGVGNGHYYEASRNWLHAHPKRSLVFLEDDLRVIRRLLGIPLGSALIKDPQVRLYAFSDVNGDDLLFHNLAWDYVLKPLQITALKQYRDKRQILLDQLSERLTYEHHRKGEIAQEYLDQGIVFYQNFYANMARLADGYLGDSLFGRFQEVPAIICGAGPSLKKQLPALGSLCDRALIFAGGSALNALTAECIHPHFSCGIDPNFPQYQRLISHTGFEVPFFFRARMNQRACHAIHGPRLYITGTGGYDTATYFEQSLGLSGNHLDEGHNVVNLCVSIAQALGCNPIIFIGLDLAYTDMQGYSAGIVSDARVTVDQISQTGIDHAAVIRPNIYGQPVYTLWKWIDEANWISEFAQQHPKLTLINATEGGIGIPGVINQPFQKVVKKHLHNSSDLCGKVWAAIQSATLPKDSEKKIQEAFQRLRASLKRCQEHAKNLLEHIKNGTYSVSVQALTDLGMEEESGYHAVLNTFNTFIDRFLLREKRELDFMHTDLGSKANKTQMGLLKKHFSFLLKVASSNIALIDHACQTREKEAKNPLPSAILPRPIKVKSMFRQKQLHGPSRICDATGRILSECHYVKGQREGLCRRYYQNGSLYAEEMYETGRLLRGKYFYPNGTLKTELDYSRGIGKIYDANGKLKRRRKLF